MQLDPVPPTSEPVLARCVDRLVDETGVAEVEAARRVVEVIRFLDIGARSAAPCAPSAGLDRAWHTMLRDPVGYADFCTRRYGSIVRHQQSSHIPLSWYERARVGAASSCPELDVQLWPLPAAMSPTDLADCYTGGDEPPGPDPKPGCAPGVEND